MHSCSFALLEWKGNGFTWPGRCRLSPPRAFANNKFFGDLEFGGGHDDRRDDDIHHHHVYHHALPGDILLLHRHMCIMSGWMSCRRHASYAILGSGFDAEKRSVTRNRRCRDLMLQQPERFSALKGNRLSFPIVDAK